jgi:hypothetical protein
MWLTCSDSFIINLTHNNSSCYIIDRRSSDPDLLSSRHQTSSIYFMLVQILFWCVDAACWYRSFMSRIFRTSLGRPLDKGSTWKGMLPLSTTVYFVLRQTRLSSWLIKTKNLKVEIVKPQCSLWHFSCYPKLVEDLWTVATSLPIGFGTKGPRVYWLYLQEILCIHPT